MDTGTNIVTGVISGNGIESIPRNPTYSLDSSFTSLLSLSSNNESTIYDECRSNDDEIIHNTKYFDDGFNINPIKNMTQLINNLKRFGKSKFCNVSATMNIMQNNILRIPLKGTRMYNGHSIAYKHEQIYIPKDRQVLMFQKLKYFLGSKLPQILGLVSQYQTQQKYLLIGLIHDLYSISDKQIINDHQIWSITYKDINKNTKTLYIVNKPNIKRNKTMKWRFDYMGSLADILLHYDWMERPNIIPRSIESLCNSNPVWYPYLKFAIGKAKQKFRVIQELNEQIQDWENIVSILPYFYKTHGNSAELLTGKAELIFVLKDYIVVTLLDDVAGVYKVVHYYKINDLEIEKLFNKINGNNNVRFSKREIKILADLGDVLKFCGLYLLATNEIKIDVNVNVVK